MDGMKVEPDALGLFTRILRLIYSIFSKTVTITIETDLQEAAEVGEKLEMRLCAPLRPPVRSD